MTTAAGGVGWRPRGTESVMQPDGGRIATSLAVVDLSFGKASLLEYWWDEPLDFVGPPATRYRIDCALRPDQRSHAAACFPQHWPSHGSEPLGPVFILPPNQQMRVRGPPKRTSSIVCEFDPAFVQSCLDRELVWTSQRLRACLNVGSGSIRNAMLRLREELLNPGASSGKMCEALAMQVAIELSRYCETLQEACSSGGLASWRLLLIEERISRPGAPPRLGELAGLCRMSERQLTRGFRESHGCSLGNYIAARQLARAKILIEEGCSVKEVAHVLGFLAPSSFSSAFRRATGMTPRAYRDSVVRLARPAQSSPSPRP